MRRIFFKLGFMPPCGGGMEEKMSKDLIKWHKKSTDERGMQRVIVPCRDETEVLGVDRLNLEKGDEYELYDEKREMNALLISGAVTAVIDGELHNLEKLDSFYVPSKTAVKITAKEKTSVYIGSAPCEGFGKSLVRKMDFTLPIGNIHQIHGKGSGQREVMFTLAPEDSASRLICGVTWSADGAWTSWPPHQHEKDLEEVYCYFDIKTYGLHFSYKTDESFGEAVCHEVQSGSMVEAPVGYHPTAAVPGSKNIYFWILGARCHESRRYDLAITDPRLV